LREIEVLRNSKKEAIISQVVRNLVGGVKLIHLIPGDISFYTHRLENNTDKNVCYTISI
jgi:hypothetical protein